MKKTRLVARHLLSLLFIACLSGTVNAAPYGPKGRLIKWVQPSGEKLNLRVYGDEFYARTETEDGFTVVYNPKDKAYHYAEVGSKGKSLKPSGIRADRPARGGLDKHVDLPVDRIRRIYQDNHDRFAGERDKQWVQRVQASKLLRSARTEGRALPAAAAAAAQAKAAPVTGNKIGLTIIVQFPDDSKTSSKDPVDFPVTRAKIADFCNKVGYNQDGNTGSVRDYFYDQSLGKVTYTQSVTQIVTLPHPRNYYNFDNYPTNSILRDTGEAGQMLILDAVTVLKTEGFDFSNLTTDLTNNAIATNLLWAGPDSGVWAEGLWPHQSSLQVGLNVGTGSNPIYLNSYQVTNVEDTKPVIGTFCHENGHLLCGYPDLYTYIPAGEGVGEHSLMGSGNFLNNGRTPCPIDAYLRNLVGWQNVNDIPPTEYQTYTLPTTGNVAYRIGNPLSSTESFYVENRGSGDKWAQHAVDKGIMIWHIDETIEGNAIPIPHYGVSLEQADGANDLENGVNRGDSTDLFDLSVPLFGSTTNPNSKWWDGSDSSVRVKVVGGTASQTKVQFGMLPANTVVLDSPNGGEVMYRESTYRITWEANIIGNLKIDLYKDESFQFNISPSAENTGYYDWVIPASMVTGNDFTVRLSTVSNPRPVYDESDAPFEITASTFPAGDTMPYGWVKPADAAVGWSVTKSSVYEGAYCISSKKLGDGKTAAVSYTSNFESGRISFYMKISSEVGYDHGSFYIDGNRQILPNAASGEGVTGNVPWTFASYPVGAGTHTFKWVYTKDDSYAGGKDRVWLDGVLLPDTTQEIAIKNQNGIQLVSGKSTTIFPAQRIGSQSEKKKFTIKNTGKADLHGLSILVKGSDPKSFKVGKPGKTVLKAGESTTFKVSFTPTKVGSKRAEIRIQSNDKNENPFVIHLRGPAQGIPAISVSQPEDRKLKDGESTVNFGYQKVDTTGNTKTFTVKNTGSASLSDLTVAKSGSHKSNFSVKAIGSTKLAPGESTTFKVTFTPSKEGQRLASLKITFNYKPAGAFDIDLKGDGAPKNVSKSAILAASSANPETLFEAVFGSTVDEVTGVTSTETIDGVKYLTLTYAKPAVTDSLTRTVEVSPNLVDWFSGPKHTTIVSDNEEFRKVRDNTPVTPGGKRFIRLKTTEP